MTQRGIARTFGQDLMRGEGGGMPNKASPGGSARPAADYAKNRARGDGTGRAAPGGSRLPAAKLGADGKFGRGDLHMTSASTDATPPASGTSIFDPVLCELAYRWFCPPAGKSLIHLPVAVCAASSLVNSGGTTPASSCARNKSQQIASKLRQSAGNHSRDGLWAIAETSQRSAMASRLIYCSPVPHMQILRFTATTRLIYPR